MRIWRISNFADLYGRGAVITAGRWHPMNTPIVYCADHPATALLEILVHLDPEDVPKTYQLLEIEVPSTVSVTVPELPSNWLEDSTATQQMGSHFVLAMEYPVMKVPCAIVPFTSNYLLNPALLERDGIRIVTVSRHAIDTRLLA
jgi:RES domain-containing protein